MNKTTHGTYGECWIDDSGNMWQCSAFGKNDVMYLSNTMHECSDCVNCSYCHACTGCVDCQMCQGCADCYRCHFCHVCFYGTYLKMCSGVNDSKNVSHSLTCNGLVESSFCCDCQDSQDLWHCEDMKGYQKRDFEVNGKEYEG